MFFLCMLVQLLRAGNIFDVFLPRYLVFLKLLKTFKIFYSAAKHFSLSFFLGFNFFCGIQINTRFFCLKSHGLFVTSLSYKLESLLFILNCLQISERSRLVTTSLQASFHFTHFVRQRSISQWRCFTKRDKQNS